MLAPLCICSIHFCDVPIVHGLFFRWEDIVFKTMHGQQLK